MSLANFEVLSKIGNGAYSEVFKVRRLSDNKTYALKKVKMQNLNRKEKKNALNEVRILASISHPNVISYKEAFFDDSGNLCLIMEYADSGDLYQKIVKYQKKGKYLSEHFIWNIFTQITQGLNALHELNILHRDMKSANVFLNSDGTAKLGDMNVSKVMKEGLLHTQTGTPYYASPEVWQDLPYNTKSDIWSLGCVLYETCTLKPPFRAEDMQGLYEKVVKGEYAPIGMHFSKDLAFVVRKLLQTDPNKRPNCRQTLGLNAVQKHFVGISEGREQNILLSSIKLTNDPDSMSEGLPQANYNLRHRSEIPSLNSSPSKDLKPKGHRSFGQNNPSLEYLYSSPFKKSQKSSLIGIRLPKISYPAKLSPLPIRKIRENCSSHPAKSLPPNDRIQQLKDAYLGKSFKLYLN